MAFQPATACIKAAINYTYLGVPVANVLHFATNGLPATSTEVTDLANSLATAWASEVMPLLSNQLTLNSVVCTGLDTPTSPQATVFASTVGGVSAAASPGNVAFVISFTSGLAGRGTRGRLYAPGLNETDVVGNSVSSTFAADLLGAIFDAIAIVEAAVALYHVIVSRFLNGSPRANGVPVVITTYGYRDLVVDTQRGRLR